MTIINKLTLQDNRKPAGKLKTRLSINQLRHEINSSINKFSREKKTVKNTWHHAAVAPTCEREGERELGNRLGKMIISNGKDA